jgi:hypothetical protein
LQKETVERIEEGWKRTRRTDFLPMAASSRASASEEVSEVLWISCPVADFSQLAILGRKFCSFLHFGLLLHVGYLHDLNEMLILVLA